MRHDGEQTSLHANHLPENLHGIRAAIEKAVPHGRTDRGGKNDRGAWSDAPAAHLEMWAKMEPAYNAIIEKYRKLNHAQRVNHLGTLGTGNHFIEVCLDENENVWFLLHSGPTPQQAKTGLARDPVLARAWGTGSARFSSSWQRTTCVSG